MSLYRPTLQELITRIENDFISRLSLPGAVLRRSVVAVLSRVIAGAAHQMYGYLEFLSRQVFPDQSEAEFLDRQAGLFGITRRAAAFASGDVTFTGTNGSVIPEGTKLQRSDGVQFVTTATDTVAGGSATVPVTSLTAGESGNTAAGVAVTLVSPIAGVVGTATVAAGGITGGTDSESDDLLRQRVLARMQQPPQGGAAHDYAAWALEVPGVTRVWVYPNHLGIGTVGVTFVMDDQGGGIIPDPATVQAVQDHIDELRPVTADVTVFAPIAVPLDFQIAVVPNTAAVQAAVEAELADMLQREAEPGGTILLSKIHEAISLAAGVNDYTLVSPSADVVHSAGEIAVMGDVTWVV